MATDEINELILEKIRKSDIDSALKRFLEEILSFERQYWNQANVRYTKDYDDLITKYAEEREG